MVGVTGSEPIVIDSVQGFLKAMERIRGYFVAAEDTQLGEIGEVVDGSNVENSDLLDDKDTWGENK